MKVNRKFLASALRAVDRVSRDSADNKLTGFRSTVCLIATNADQRPVLKVVSVAGHVEFSSEISSDSADTWICAVDVQSLLTTVDNAVVQDEEFVDIEPRGNTMLGIKMKSIVTTVARAPADEAQPRPRGHRRLFLETAKPNRLASRMKACAPVAKTCTHLSLANIAIMRHMGIVYFGAVDQRRLISCSTDYSKSDQSQFLNVEKETIMVFGEHAECLAGFLAASGDAPDDSLTKIEIETITDRDGQTQKRVVLSSSIGEMSAPLVEGSRDAFSLLEMMTAKTAPSEPLCYQKDKLLDAFSLCQVRIDREHMRTSATAMQGSKEKDGLTIRMASSKESVAIKIDGPDFGDKILISSELMVHMLRSIKSKNVLLSRTDGTFLIIDSEDCREHTIIMAMED